MLFYWGGLGQLLGCSCEDLYRCRPLAMDIGASPGGWSYCLAKELKVRQVIACDPAAYMPLPLQGGGELAKGFGPVSAEFFRVLYMTLIKAVTAVLLEHCSNDLPPDFKNSAVELPGIQWFETCTPTSCVRSSCKILRKKNGKKTKRTWSDWTQDDSTYYEVCFDWQLDSNWWRDAQAKTIDLDLCNWWPFWGPTVGSNKVFFQWPFCGTGCTW